MKTKETKRIKLQTSVASPIQAKFQDDLGVRVIGQPNGVALAARARARAENPLRNKRRPIYVALLLGPTSVGKTETVREAAFLTHGDQDAFIQINAAAYKEKHRISQLIGAPPGYVGYKDSSDKSEDERKKKGLKDKSAKLSKENLIASRKGSNVDITYVLIDELEKAGEDFYDLLLSIFEDGVIDFGNNDEADFRQVVFFLTGNVGAFEVARLGNRIGFNIKPVTQDDIEGTVEGAMKNVFKPEFLARIDEICVYNKLSKDDLLRIVGTEVARLQDRILNDLPRGTAFELRVDGLGEAYLLEQALINGDNARDIRRICDKLLTDCLGNELMKGNIPLGALVEVTFEKGDSELSFFVTEGQGQVASADLLGGNAINNQTGVSLQRGIERAKHEMKRGVGTVGHYVVTVPSSRDENPMEQALGLLHDIQKVFGLEIVKWSIGLKPSFVEVEVIMTSAFEPHIKRVYKTAIVKPIVDSGTTASAQ